MHDPSEVEGTVASVFDTMTINLKAGDTQVSELTVERLVPEKSTSNAGGVKIAIVRHSFIMKLLGECDHQISRVGDTVPLTGANVDYLRCMCTSLHKFYQSFSIERPEGEAGKERGSVSEVLTNVSLRHALH